MDRGRYRFLPWVRRGLVAATAPDSGGALPARARIEAGITVTNVGTHHVNLALYGPGDVLGIDPRLIVRCSPTAGTTDAEPNYFPTIDFDPPDFPWLFTPASADGNDRLRPWLVLVVVDRARVAPPKANRLRPLPTIRLEADVAAEELPDLSESWAWAHTQVLVGTESPEAIGDTLEREPELRVSRLMCLRRLAPNRNYVACLVPAFDAGVVRGLGGRPDPSKPLGPAWSNPPGPVELPVYFHWEFATGPLGDFESLARRLKPMPATGRVGGASLYVGDADPRLPVLDPSDPGATVQLDGALRSPERNAPSLADVPAPVREGLKRVLSPAKDASTGEGARSPTPALTPPLYGAWHARHHGISAAAPTWMRELNLDPRARAAAGLGTEIVRRNQESFMQQAWEQVGEVLKANERLSFARLSLEAAARVFERRLRPLPADQLLTLTAPTHGRIRGLAGSLWAQIRASSVPNAFADPALRRLTSPRHPVIKATVRRLAAQGRLSGAFATQRRSALLSDFAVGKRAVDPTSFLPDGLVASKTLDSAIRGRGLDLRARGSSVTIPEARVAEYRNTADPLRSRDFQKHPIKLVLRADLRTTGLLARVHVEHLAELAVSAARPLDLFGGIRSLLTTAAANPKAQSLSVTQGQSALTVKAVVAQSSELTIRPEVLSNLSILGRNLVSGALFERIQLGTLTLPVETQKVLAQKALQPLPAVVPTMTQVPPLMQVAPTVVATPSIELPKPDATSAAIDRYQAEFQRLITGGQIGVPIPADTFVALDVATAARSVLERLDPARTALARVRHLVKIGDRSFEAAEALGLRASPTIDRILAAPDLPAPAYAYLAEEFPERFLPGIGEIAPNSISLLETNPTFIEAFLVGMNYEMCRELLWRGYPTDQRGTPFRFFWQWLDGGADIQPIHTWNARSSLGSHARGAGKRGQIVMLVRGDLVRRYPNAVLSAWKATADGARLQTDDDAVRAPVFQGRIGADALFAGFDLTEDEVLADGGYFFVISEQPTDARFGFDEPERNATPKSTLTRWSDASWAETGVEPGGYLRLAGNPLAGRSLGGLVFGSHAGALAAITVQRPTRVALHGRSILSS